MNANLEKKHKVVSELSEKFKSSGATFVADYKGCSCQELTNLRAKLTEKGASMAVVKNTLAKRAVEGTESEKLLSEFIGPVAVIWSNEDDPVSPAKILDGFAKEQEKFELKSAVFEGQLLDQSGVKNLASMPSKEELFAKLLALMNAPATKLLQTINAPGAQVVTVLNAWKGKLEEKN